MAIEVTWDTPERTAIRWDFIGQWTQEDLFNAEEATDALLLQAPEGVVDLVLNLGDTTYWAQNAIIAMKNILKRTSRGTGVKIIVGASGVTQRLLTVFSKMDKPFVEGLTFVTTMDEAREILVR